MICQLSARSGNSIVDLSGLGPAALATLADEVRRRDDEGDWTNLHEAIAQVHDLLSLMRVEHLAGIGVKRHDLPTPARMPRPGDKPAEPVVLSPGEAARLMMAA